MSNTIKVVITDDHPMIVTGLELVLNAADSICVTATYTSGKALLEGLKKEVPDVLLLDLQLPDILGKDLARRIRRTYPTIRIVILTSLEATHHIEDMIDLGCVGYLLKTNTDKNLLVQVVRQVYEGRQFIDPTLGSLFLTNVQKKKKQREESEQILTRREREVLQLIVKEHTNQDIADKLHISIRTVECHRLSMIHKLKVKNTAGLVKKAVELHLVKA